MECQSVHSHHRRLRSVLVFSASFLLLTGGNARAQDPVETDRAALVALYNATGSPRERAERGDPGRAGGLNQVPNHFVKPFGLRALLQSHMQRPAQTLDQLTDPGRSRRHHGLQHDLPFGIHHRQHCH